MLKKYNNENSNMVLTCDSTGRTVKRWEREGVKQHNPHPAELLNNAKLKDLKDNTH